VNARIAVFSSVLSERKLGTSHRFNPAMLNVIVMTDCGQVKAVKRLLLGALFIIFLFF